jgi:hypothetical protein
LGAAALGQLAGFAYVVTIIAAVTAPEIRAKRPAVYD